MQRRFDDAVDVLPGELIRNSMRLLGQIEHELDWGHACDTCLRCARLRVLSALDTFYDDSGHAQNALAVLRDREAVENYCDECLERMPSWGRREGARPTLAERDREIARRLAVSGG
jgi:hypothetical protein